MGIESFRRGQQPVRHLDNAAVPAAARSGRTFFHGGYPDLQPGQFLLSFQSARAKLGPLRAEAIWNRGRGKRALTDQTKVYLATNIDFARAYAATMKIGRRTGTLYRVEPIGRVETDPDWDHPGITKVSFTALSARILEVVETNVSMSSEDIGRAWAPRQVWGGGTPYVTAAGTVQASPAMARAGWTPEALELLPKWVLLENLGRELSALLLREPDRILRLAPKLIHAPAKLHQQIKLEPEAIALLSWRRRQLPGG